MWLFSFVSLELRLYFLRLQVHTYNHMITFVIAFFICWSPPWTQYCVVSVKFDRSLICRGVYFCAVLQNWVLHPYLKTFLAYAMLHLLMAERNKGHFFREPEISQVAHTKPVFCFCLLIFFVQFSRWNQSCFYQMKKIVDMVWNLGFLV